MKRFLLGALVFLVLVAVGTAFWVYQQYQHFLQQPLPIAEHAALVNVKPGSNIRTVARLLTQQGALKASDLNEQQWFFIARARETQQASKIKAGEYQLSPAMTVDEVLALLVSGQSVQYSLALIEGKTIKSVIQQVKQHEHIQQTLTEADYEDLLAQLDTDVKAQNPEGWFLPDTYHFPRNTTDKEFFQRSHDLMRHYLQQAWEGREESEFIKTPYEALILASIVEKETGVAEERGKIAGVFYNRLKKGMLLQTDPTVIYGMGDDYDGNIRKSDLRRDTPYNTYTRKGLPPTPIATPSKAAIDAVMHPEATDAFYFVATGTGGHRFSRTYKEHQRAVRDYLRELRKQKKQKQ